MERNTVHHYCISSGYEESLRRRVRLYYNDQDKVSSVMNDPFQNRARFGSLQRNGDETDPGDLRTVCEAKLKGGRSKDRTGTSP